MTQVNVSGKGADAKLRRAMPLPVSEIERELVRQRHRPQENAGA